jgi:hypothetical protein
MLENFIEEFNSAPTATFSISSKIDLAWANLGETMITSAGLLPKASKLLASAPD